MGVCTTKKHPSISHLSLLSPSAKSRIQNPNPKNPKTPKNQKHQDMSVGSRKLSISTSETKDLMVNIISWTSIRGALIMTMTNLR